MIKIVGLLRKKRTAIQTTIMPTGYIKQSDLNFL